MASAFWRAASRATLPLSTAYVSQSKLSTDAEPQLQAQQQPTQDASSETVVEAPKHGMRPNETGDYLGLFPRRQLWHPKFPYPQWDPDWDGRTPPSTGDAEHDRKRMRHIRKTGVTRHLIFVRHGQYDEAFKVRNHIFSKIVGSRMRRFLPCPRQC